MKTSRTFFNGDETKNIATSLTVKDPWWRPMAEFVSNVYDIVKGIKDILTKAYMKFAGPSITIPLPEEVIEELSGVGPKNGA